MAQTAEQQTSFEHPDAQFEVRLQATWPYKDWQIELQGRIDQVIPQANGLLLREVKTIRSPLPAAQEELTQNYPNTLPKSQFIGDWPAHCRSSPRQHSVPNYSSSISMTAPCNPCLAEADAERFDQQLAALYPFLKIAVTRSYD